MGIRRFAIRASVRLRTRGFQTGGLRDLDSSLPICCSLSVFIFWDFPDFVGTFPIFVGDFTPDSVFFGGKEKLRPWSEFLGRENSDHGLSFGCFWGRGRRGGSQKHFKNEIHA